MESYLKDFLEKAGSKNFKVKYYSCTTSIFDNNSLLGTGVTVGNKTAFMEIIIRGRRQIK